MASRRSAQIFTADELKLFLDVSQTSPDVLAALVSTHRRRTELSLGRPGLPYDYVVCLLEVLIKASQCGSDATDVIDLLTLVVGSRFFTHELAATLSSVSVGPICEEGALKYIQNLVMILRHVSLRLPNSFTNAFGLVIILQKRTEEMLLTAKDEQRKSIMDLSSPLSDMRDSVMKRMVKYSSEDSQFRFERQAPPEDFRTIPILPRISDIFLTSSGIFLRKNKPRGGYENLQHYLDVQFRLYREDCISPLRDGITQYVQEASAGHFVRKLQDGRLYKNVQIQYAGHSMEGEMYNVKLDTGHAHRIKWKSSRRLIYGSLLCLSADNFHTMVFAVVEDSDRDKLANEHIFTMVIPPEVGEVTLPSNATFTMVESSAYFESYRHVLIGLQNIEEGELPFERYIVACEKEVGPPLYLQEDSVKYDLQPILDDDVIYKCFDSYYPDRFRVRICSPMSEWPSADQLHLDQSQFEAFHAALTQEFVLIQGPPGTGKTHVGLQIAKTLLHNREKWQSYDCDDDEYDTPNRINQMLIVCFTNHALDQFMEGIVKFLDDDNKNCWKQEIVRVGGRSENEAIEEFALKSRRRLHHRSRHDRYEYDRRIQFMERDLQQQHNCISVINYSLRHLHHIILDIECLEQFMEERHRDFFSLGDKQCRSCEDELVYQSKNLFLWLEADEMSWHRKAEKSYKAAIASKTPQKLRRGQEYPTADTEDFEGDDEARKIEDDRRIEDDDLKRKVSVNIGLDINQAINYLVEQNNPQVDDQFKSFLQKEAHGTSLRLRSTDAMSDEEVDKISGHLEKRSLNDRWKLYKHWVGKYRQDQRDKLPALEQRYSQAIKDYKKEKKEVDAEILAESTVIAMTTTGAARYQDVLKDIGPRIVIVEEAAEVLEAHIVTALSSRCEHLILIGDHKQLEPKPSVMQLALKYNLSLSMFERMLNNGIANHCLQRQHRMRPEISTLVRDIYPVLEDNENVFLYDHILGVKRDLFFLSHSQPEDYADDIKSYSNKHEARFVGELCRYLLKQGYSRTQITILAAYTGQMFRIRECMPRRDFEGVRTVAIDNFQGEENDIIILSLVRSNTDQKIGFLKRENRMCVALSRAKKGLYVVGNFSMFESASPRWANVVQKVKKAGQFGTFLPLYCQNHPHAQGIDAKDATDFVKSPEGGCELPCDFRLPCGHTCKRLCHHINKQHTGYMCRRRCDSLCPNDHACKKICHYGGEPCMCPVKIAKPLPCGHEAMMPCHQPPDTFRCDTVVDRNLSCGHSARLKCHIDIARYTCRRIVKRILEPCSHEASMACHKDPAKIPCRTKVTRTLEQCGHEAELECCANTEEYTCTIVVTGILTRCDHEFNLECWKDPADFKCTKIVTNTRTACGHAYDVVCSKYSGLYETSHPCEEIMTKTWGCMHSEKMVCSKTTRALCKEKCLKVCDREHTCKKRCHYPQTCDCDVRVEKTIPKCGHKMTILCYKDPADETCKEQVQKILPKCGHLMSMQCCEDPALGTFRRKCQEIVQKTVPRCGHAANMTCTESPWTYDCTKIVDKIHPKCGHTIKYKCIVEPPIDTECKELIGKRILPCGHQKEMECTESMQLLETLKCTEKVLKEMPECKHLNEMLCRQSAEEVECCAPVDVTLPKCGHTVLVRCYELEVVMEEIKRKTLFTSAHLTGKSLIPTCRSRVARTFPCGHSTTFECNKRAPVSCVSDCPYILSCGHECRGKCTQCSKRFLPLDCGRPCKKVLICGHQCTSTTCGSCPTCVDKCEHKCPHRECQHPCTTECTPCKEPCSLQCPHYECSRMCFEECDRPRCEQRCDNLLVCSHQCMGYCGEHCPNVCIICQPDRLTDFTDSPSGENIFIVRLGDCGHEFEATYLDKIFDEHSDILRRLLCPKCDKMVRWHARYSHLIKKQKTQMDNVKVYISSCSDSIGNKAQFPMLVEGYTEVRTYINRFNTCVYLQEKIHSEQVHVDLSLSHKWSASTVGEISTFLDNLRSSNKLQLQHRRIIDQTLMKLSAVWLLFISNKCTSVNKKTTNTKMQATQSVAVGSSKTVKRIQLLIRNTHTFTSSDLQKVGGALKPLLIDMEEVNRVLDYPSLVTVGIHREDWVVCAKGHAGPADKAGIPCCECSSGTPWTIDTAFLTTFRDLPGPTTAPDTGRTGGSGSSDGYTQSASARDTQRGKRGRDKSRNDATSGREGQQGDATEGGLGRRPRGRRRRGRGKCFEKEESERQEVFSQFPPGQWMNMASEGYGYRGAYWGGEQEVRGGGRRGAYWGGEQEVREGGRGGAYWGGEQEVRGGGYHRPFRGGEQEVRGGGRRGAYWGGEPEVRGGGRHGAYWGGEQEDRGGGRRGAYWGGEQEDRGGGPFRGRNTRGGKGGQRNYADMGESDGGGGGNRRGRGGRGPNRRRSHGRGRGGQSR